ncbi:MAG: potassium channel family protein [Acidimicrobiia bacterium]|nr:potassium channel family protein [Acidimicrobiia bacterium]
MTDETDETDEGTLEQRLPGYRYGIVLFLLLATFIFECGAFSGVWAGFFTVTLQCATLLAAFLAAGVSRRLMRIASFVSLGALGAALVAALLDSNFESGWYLALSFLLVLAAPVVIVRSIIRRRVVDIRTVLGALCIYVMLGMLWAFLFGAVGSFSSTPFFTQTNNATSADYVYFSFVTLTTTGYGDLTAISGLGRAVAVLEALSGQLYLVTIVSLLVAQIAKSALPGLREKAGDAAAPRDES